MLKTSFYLVGLLLFFSWPITAQTPLPETKPENKIVANNKLGLSPEAAQVADQIRVADLLKKLADLKTDQTDTAPNLESLVLRQEITERVLAASLDIDSVNAVIDSEVEQIRDIRSDLQSRRDKAQNIINIASLVTGGVSGVIGTAMQFRSSTSKLGNGVTVGGGATSVVMALIGIHKQNGGRSTLGNSPRMLARFFGRQPAAEEAVKSEYPDDIWSYLNSADPSGADQGTRKEQLIKKWQTEGRVGPDDSPKWRRKLEFLTDNTPQPAKLSIDDLSDGITMLQDVRAKVSLMKRDLGEILRFLSIRQDVR